MTSSSGLYGITLFDSLLCCAGMEGFTGESDRELEGLRRMEW